MPFIQLCNFVVRYVLVCNFVVCYFSVCIFVVCYFSVCNFVVCYFSVCNFVVHEKCLKTVVSPCSSIAATLIKVSHTCRTWMTISVFSANQTEVFFPQMKQNSTIQWIIGNFIPDCIFPGKQLMYDRWCNNVRNWCWIEVFRQPRKKSILQNLILRFYLRNAVWESKSNIGGRVLSQNKI